MRYLTTYMGDEVNFKFGNTGSILKLKAIDNHEVKSFDEEHDLKIKVKNEKVYVKTVDATSSGREVLLPTSSLIDLPVGQYDLELWAETSKGRVIYPDEGFLKLSINGNATQMTGDLFSSLTLADLEKEIEDALKLARGKIDEKIGEIVGGTSKIPQISVSDKGTLVVDGKDTGTVIRGEKGEPGRDGIDGSPGKDGHDGAKGEPGQNGKSAYELALDDGFVGSEIAWLESLKGKDGSKGDRGETGSTGRPGIDGKSAYELAVDNGFTGTQAEWFNSLKGKDGKDGVDGESAYDVAKRNGFTGSEKEFVRSILASKDGMNINETFDKYSNQYHFNMLDEGFLNDVQGAFYRKGLWHLYFLYNADARYKDGENVGGNGSEWYHVTTKDWIKWNYEGVAIHKYQTEWGDVASGSMYIDFDNRFGMGKDAVIVFATAYGGDKGQNTMAYYSVDDGYTFEPLKNTPIMRHPGESSDVNFRDPFLFRMGDKWVQYVAEGDKIGIYSSDNPLGDYRYVGGYFAPHPILECPALFAMNVDGDKSRQKWVLFYGGNGGEEATTGTYASIGNLDEEFVFTPEQEGIRIDLGTDFYGAKIFSDGSNDYVFANSWMGNWGYATKVPNEGRIGVGSLTRVLKLTTVDGKYKFNSKILGVDKYLGNPIVGTDLQTDTELPKFKGDTFYLKVKLKDVANYSKNAMIKIAGNGYDIDFNLDFSKNQGRVHRYNSSFVGDPIFAKDRLFPLDISGKGEIEVGFYVDRTTIEIELPDNEIYSLTKYPNGASREVISVVSDERIKFDYEYYQIGKSDGGSVVVYDNKLINELSSRVNSLFVNINDYGAKAEDPNFDNATAFNKAIDSLPPVGGTIFIPNGNYFIKTPINVNKSYVHIMGLNNGLRSGIDPADGSTQLGGGGAKVVVTEPISAFKLKNDKNGERLSGITFSGFDLRGDTNNGVGIDGISNTDRVIIDNMTINNIGIGVRLHAADAPKITNSWIAETQSSILLTGASQQAEIKNNSLGAQPKGVTVLLENPDRFNVGGNNIYPDGAAGIRMMNPVHGNVSGNTISSYYTGVIEMLANAEGVTGNGNVVSGNVISVEDWHDNPDGKDEKWGIIHMEAFTNIIANNNIIGNNAPKNSTGILIMKGDNNRVSNNLIMIGESDSKVVCNGAVNDTRVIYSCFDNEFQDGANSSNRNISL